MTRLLKTVFRGFQSELGILVRLFGPPGATRPPKAIFAGYRPVPASSCVFRATWCYQAFHSRFRRPPGCPSFLTCVCFLASWRCHASRLPHICIVDLRLHSPCICALAKQRFRLSCPRNRNIQRESLMRLVVLLAMLVCCIRAKSSILSQPQLLGAMVCGPYPAEWGSYFASIPGPGSISPNCWGTWFVVHFCGPKVTPKLGPLPGGVRGGVCRVAPLALCAAGLLVLPVVLVLSCLHNESWCCLLKTISWLIVVVVSASGSAIQFCCVMLAIRHDQASERVEALAEAEPGHTLLAATAVDSCMEGQEGTTKGNILQCDVIMDFFCEELEDIQALRAVCRDCISEATTQALCHLAFHENELILDPGSDPNLPIWCRCLALYSLALD